MFYLPLAAAAAREGDEQAACEGAARVGARGPILAISQGRLSADVYVEANDRTVDDESARAEWGASRETGGEPVRDLCGSGGEVGLTDVLTPGDGGVSPRFEVNVPDRAVVELRRRFRHFF